MDFLLIFSFIVLLAVLLFLLFKLFEAFLPLLFWGAIYVPTKQEKVEKMVRMADIKSGQKTADIGAGDGRLVIALARTGAQSHGYEINPFLVLIARKNIRKAGLAGKAFVHWKSFWAGNFSDFDAVTVYGMYHMMGRLEKKLKRELKQGAKVISLSFVFPNWNPSEKDGNIYLYVK